MSKFYKAIATCDWDEEKNACFTNGEVWNGWGTPYFELKEALNVIKSINNDSLAETEISFNEKKDMFIINSLTENSSEEVSGINIKVDNKDIKVYPIGAFSWCWNVKKEVVKKPKMN